MQRLLKYLYVGCGRPKNGPTSNARSTFASPGKRRRGGLCRQSCTTRRLVIPRPALTRVLASRGRNQVGSPGTWAGPPTPPCRPPRTGAATYLADQTELFPHYQTPRATGAGPVVSAEAAAQDRSGQGGGS